jgi:hypothetical protein
MDLSTIKIKLEAGRYTTYDSLLAVRALCVCVCVCVSVCVCLPL